MCVGLLRLGSTYLGLVALGRLPVSFTETIKSSAPLVTAVVSALILGQRTTLAEAAALLPIVLGLGLSSFSELSFEAVGFVAALATNCVDCVQNVYSKKLMSSAGYTATQLQFYATAAALLAQLPMWCITNAPSLDMAASFYYQPQGHGQEHGLADALAGSYSTHAAAFLVLDGLFCYLQSIMAYNVVARVSPVTMSVGNAAKRAVLICVSTVVFGNPMGLCKGFGTALLLGGVLLYNFAKQGATKAHSD